MKRLFYLVSIFSFALLLNVNSYAQGGESYEEEAGGGEPEEAANAPTPIVRDGAYDKISVKEKEILEYDHLREADIFWQKRVWRVIDTRQKMNLTFTYPEQPFIDVLLSIVRENADDINIFMDDSFTSKLTLAEVESNLGSVDTITVIDPDTYEETTTIVKNDFNWEQVKQFRLKEDWLFDEESSTMVVRILAIAPVMDVLDDNGNYRGQQAMFYAYYPDFRQYFMNYEVFNPLNDAQRLTWDDIFEMRLFSSYIMKESNIHDRRIQNYADGRDALLEAERVKKEIFEAEHNLWSY